ncbi:MAG: hypothetical protein NTY96_08915 [Bacteroidetes bacterium]|nr:hypothetical protein [Bacteroidota bacterium]
MRYLLPLLLFIFSGLVLKGQTTGTTEEGTVSFISSQSVYVKFLSTGRIKAGDTLFVMQGDKLIPSLIVKDLSSISCVCIPVSSLTPAVGNKIYHRPGLGSALRPEAPAPTSAVIPTEKKSDSTAVTPVTASTPAIEKPKPKAGRQAVHGFFQIASYTDFSNNSSTNSQRMKYTFSLMGRNLGNTNLSAEVFLSFTHSNQNWNEIQSNIFNGLKVYNLNLNYDFGTKASLLLGRKINPKLSNMGANDGLQFELKFKPISIGVIAGFRPDYTDYSFNANLFQLGAYLYNEYKAKNGTMQTTLAFINQTNNWNTDRRFVYLQHVNSLVKNLTFFGSVELDLYKLVFNQPDSTYKSSNTFNLTNLYLSLNYRVIKQLSLSFSYSARQNVIYYETYKNLLEKLTDPQTLQGYSLQAVIRPANKLAIGLTGGYRFEKADPKPSKNFYGYITYTQIPGINVAATATVTILQTSYINGNIYGIGLSKDLVAGKLFAGLNYRYTDYRFYNNEMTTLQNVGEVNLSWRIWKKFSMSVYYEGTFEKSEQYNRIYAQINLGF